MRIYWRSVWLALLVVAFWATAASAQAPPATPTLTHAIGSNWIKFQIVAGRLRIAGTQVSTMTTSSGSLGSSEHFSIVQGDNGGPSLKYELLTAQERLSLDASGDGRLHIVRGGRSESKLVPVEFEQSPGEPLSLRVGPPPQQEIFQAASLWHLLILQPEICRRHLLPLLGMLYPDGKLDRVEAAVEKELLRLAAGGAALDRGRWAALVEQLGENQFARREAADRELRAASPAVLGYLEQLDFSRLDAEQQFRVRRIIGSLSGQLTGEMADQIASWLSGDASVWLGLLSRGDPFARRLAARQLAALLGGPITFDPDADEAVRSRQIDKLRPLVEGKKNGP